MAETQLSDDGTQDLMVTNPARVSNFCTTNDTPKQSILITVLTDSPSFIQHLEILAVFIEL